jgi:TonB family protein
MRIKPPPAAPKPTVAPPLPDQPAEAPEPEAATAPPALLAEGTAASAGGIVQQPFATVSSLASLSGSGRTGPTSAPPARAATGDSLALAKLSDLSRKPRAPSLDASLRQHYPDELRRRGVEGQAEVRVIVSARGRVEHVSVVSETAAGFAQACKNTLLGSQWSEPLDREGKPVNTRLTYRCRFQVGR